MWDHMGYISGNTRNMLYFVAQESLLTSAGDLLRAYRAERVSGYVTAMKPRCSRLIYL